ncbi:MAG: hypothetical protein ACOVQ7_12675 [Limnoraphis robusta]
MNKSRLSLCKLDNPGQETRTSALCLKFFQRAIAIYCTDICRQIYLSAQEPREPPHPSFLLLGFAAQTFD